MNAGARSKEDGDCREAGDLERERLEVSRSCPKVPPRTLQAVAGCPLPAALVIENQPAKRYADEETDNREHLDD